MTVNHGTFVPLYEKIWPKRSTQRFMDTMILLLLLLLLCYRFFSVKSFTIPWLLAFICESWFTFTWIVILNTKWSPALTKTHLDRLQHRVPELPPVDLLVTTADPVLEPPIITVNTVLSLLALDYPPNKLSCYVSDDGCSPLTFYGLLEASKYAKLWVPFCKKYNIQVRAPFRYFSAAASGTSSEQDSQEFRQEWSTMKDMYDNLSLQIEKVTRKSIPLPLDGDFSVFLNTDRRNHPSIVKVILENKEGICDGLPQLIYISREKRPQYPYHYKAGAMNVLTRVSGLMSNAPFMLNVDCDMVVNNPKIVQHAMCVLMDPEKGKEVAFVQCFQQFYDGIKDDPFGNQWVAAFEYIIRGMAGLQGPFYGGTNTFHRRSAIYGLYPDELQSGSKENLADNILLFGNSKEFMKSATHALEGNAYSPSDLSPSNFTKAAIHVSNCEYENGTSWGKQLGWVYGSISEDVPTGLNIQRRGWRSEGLTPNPTAFTGCAPGGLLSTIVQQKRWASGLTVVFFGKYSPVLCTLFGKVKFRSALSYCWLTNWGLRSIHQVCYAVLPAYCLITNTTFLPKGLGLWIPVSLFVTYYMHTLVEYLTIGLSIRHWWNNQRMSMITTMTAWFIGFLSAILKLLGISDSVFEITQKGDPTCGGDEEVEADGGRFTFEDSPVFVAGTTILLVQLAALFIKLLGLQPAAAQSGNGSGPGELICSTLLVVCFWPYLKGFFGTGKYGIPLSTLCKSSALAIIFVHLSRITS